MALPLPAPGHARPSRPAAIYALVLLTLSYALNFMDRYALAAMAEAIKADLKLTDTQVGLLIGFAFSLVYSVCGIPLALLADRTSRKRVLAASIAVWSLMTMLGARAGSFAALAACRMGVGVGEAGGVPPAHALLADLFSPRSLPAAIGVYSSGSAVGLALGLGLGATLADTYGWRQALVILGAPGVILAAVIWLTLREPARTGPRRAQAARRPFWPDLLGVARNAGLRRLSMAMSLAAVAGFGALAWLPALLHRRFAGEADGLDQALSQAIGAANLGGVLLGGVIAGFVARRGGDSVRIVCSVSVLAAAPLLWTACAAATPGLFVAAAAAGVFFHSLILAPVMTGVQQLAGPDSRALSSASLLLVMNIVGLGGGPFLIGVLSDSLQDLGGAAALSVALGVAIASYLLSAALFLAPAPNAHPQREA